MNLVPEIPPQLHFVPLLSTQLQSKTCLSRAERTSAR